MTIRWMIVYFPDLRKTQPIQLFQVWKCSSHQSRRSGGQFQPVKQMDLIERFRTNIKT
jgi:hypothetical protein